jgi:HEAT repeat protein
MNFRSPARFWPVLLFSALLLVVLLFWWLESGQQPAGSAVGASREPATVQPDLPPATAKDADRMELPPVAAVQQALKSGLDPEQSRRLADWLRQWQAAPDAAARDEVLEDARSHEETEVLVELVLHHLARTGPEERLEGLQKLVGSSGSSQIKAFVKGLEDAEAEVREAALQFVRDQEVEVRVPVFEHGLNSPHAEVRADSFLELTRENVKSAIPALMRALASADAGVREEAASQLAVRLADTRTEPFNDASEALRWWEVNARRYDARMYRID